MNSIAKLIIALITTVGLTFTAVAATNNEEGSGAQQGNAQGAHPGGGPHRVCRADVQKLCSGVKPGEGRIIACLKENSSKLSPACAERLSKASGNKAHEQEEENAEK